MLKQIPEIDLEKIPLHVQARLTSHLLRQYRDFYQDPENERGFQEWKAKRDAANKAKGVPA